MRSGQVGARRPHFRPAPVRCLEQLAVTRLDRHINGPTLEVELPHSVSSDRRGLPDRGMILPVPRAESARPEEALATSSYLELGQRQVALLAGGAEQLDERHLDLGMSVDAFASASSQLGFDVIDGPGGDRDEPPIPERSLPRDSGLDEMTDAVELVAPSQVAIGLATRESHERAQVAIRSLRCGDEIDDLAGLLCEVDVLSATQLPTLQPRAICTRPNRGTET